MIKTGVCGWFMAPGQAVFLIEIDERPAIRFIRKQTKKIMWTAIMARNFSVVITTPSVHIMYDETNGYYYLFLSYEICRQKEVIKCVSSAVTL